MTGKNKEERHEELGGETDQSTSYKRAHTHTPLGTHPHAPPTMTRRLATLVSLVLVAAAAADAAADAHASPPSRGWTTTIAPGVHMPWVNLGTCCGSDPNIGVAPWLAASSALFAQPHIAGIDTAFDYDDQKAIAAQLKGAAGGQGARGRVFITTKIPGAALLNKDPKIVRMEAARTRVLQGPLAPGVHRESRKAAPVPRTMRRPATSCAPATHCALCAVVSHRVCAED